MRIYKTVEADVDVELELEDVIDFITGGAGEKDLQEIFETVCDELGINQSSINSGIESTQRYDDLMEAVNNAVNRHVDLRVMTDIINTLK
jgi:coenzyme F420-reducing hydrogenase delta subunit